VSRENAKRPLLALGFSELEADVYVFLLEHPVSTGYKVAQGLGKLPPNVYQAIDSLVTKGAVITESGTSRTCRAVPPDEMLASLRSRFAATEAEAMSALQEVRPPADDDRVYRLRDWPQVHERCRAMLNGAQRVAVIDAFPGPLALIQADVERTAARGVQVALKTYEQKEIRGAKAVINHAPDALLAKFPAEFLILIADGSELLIASLARGTRTVKQAIWTPSPTLAYLFHASLAAEISITEVLGVLAGMTRFDQLTELLAPVRERLVAIEPTHLGEVLPGFWRLYQDVPGFQRLGDAGKTPAD
jgi:HTH-type transcriptional regulator, sugar sensing transcriptional regulator